MSKVCECGSGAQHLGWGNRLIREQLPHDDGAVVLADRYTVLAVAAKANLGHVFDVPSMLGSDRLGGVGREK